VSKRFLRKAAVAARYGVNVRTVERMILDGRLPRPHYRGKFPLFDESELDKSDRAFVAASRSNKPAPQAA
jgi:predicted DNA-binding transcriptional regulator AlpA